MDWRCLSCRREGTRWFEYEANTVEVPNSSSIKIDYGLQIELAETEHSLTGCKGRLEQEGGTYRQVDKSAFKDPLWLEVTGRNT
jgi:hypothetical protein